MKLFPNAHATHPQWRMAAALVLAQLQAQMAQPQYARKPSLGLLYITDHYVADAVALLRYLGQQLPSVADWSGTVGVGVAGNNVEYFDEPALSIMLCDLPPEQYRVFSGVAPLPLGASAFSAHTALVHADGRTPDLAELLVEMAGRTSSGYLFGGVAASRGASLAFAQHAGGDGAASGVLSGGLSGVAFSDQVGLVSRVTQDCQPIGPQAVVTQAQDNVVLRLDGQPALDVLLQTLGVELNGDPQPALRAVRHTLAGLSNADAPALQGTGHFGADTRVRHIVGLDVARGGVALADRVHEGMHLAFCQRHMAAARADLTRICAEIREELAPESPALPDEQAATQRRICGALYVSCSGRGGRHFGGPSAELQTVHRALGDVPLVGFFASGEIAAHWLYGYTGLLTVFVAPADTA
ncbi:MAG TPA: FIST C-terminal domain-containing protein [Alicycliphilus sp.]|jgi:small ligand-binding sensory domain FIST|uniref:FIST C-terminal domain-containing protein n=1 Tax=Diaphorobacter limosus TaxID=3036128 RepID=A0ABZ0J0D6_9BURK|nr:FIST C-terminal domain-containing protein [Diaphorobacter sp. Y-1]MBP6753494.1 FIST C-terminal domain-containing protein [Alicycliphilus sp.]MBP7440629.1 FIST C-terminal domain-containing protein [Acidovorax sp.]MCA0441225.1 FIST C-terminal domain-containing protein [Pseudomonadota bacterium]MBP7328759.1 FIST C-terminal domain-containing protein [Alicycliphilus sp.]MBP8780634.1 FIST C-terminal domain-containing protein [Alicycliphilus sp.]